MTRWEDKVLGIRPSLPSLASLPPDPSLAQALAAWAYRFKSGESVVLQLPVQQTDFLVDICKYIHDCRIDALRGYQKSGWLNAKNLSGKKDLLIWSKKSVQYQLLKNDSDLGLVDISKLPSEDLLNQDAFFPDRILRTLLCQVGSKLTENCDIISRVGSPFLIIIDQTPFGFRDDLIEVVDHMREYFPNIPLLVIGALGDAGFDARMSKGDFGLFWRQTIGDLTPLSDKKKPRHRLEIQSVNDTRLNNRLLKANDTVRLLHHSLALSPFHRDKYSKPLYRILGNVRRLLMPFTFHEDVLARHRRGGLYPIKPYSEIIADLSYGNLPSGEAENLRRQAIQDIREIFDLIKTGASGKEQALRLWLQSLNLEDECLIIVEKEGEARYLRTYLASDYGEMISDKSLSVVGAGSVRDCSKQLNKKYSKILIAGDIWKDNLWVFSLGEETLWLAYDFEVKHFQKLGATLLSNFSQDNSTKLAWWNLEPAQYLPLDVGERVPDVSVLKVCTGEYTTQVKVEIEIPDDKNWLENLLSESAEIENEPPKKAELGLTDEIVVTTNTGTVFRFGSDEKVHVLKNSEDLSLTATKAGDIEINDHLVTLISGDDSYQSLLGALIGYAAENSQEYQIYVALSEKWHTYIDLAMIRFGSVEKLHQILVENGNKIGIESVRRWSNHLAIGPENPNTVNLMAKLAKTSDSDQHIDQIKKAQKKIRGLHRLMGKQFKKIALAAGTGEVHVTGSDGYLFDPQELSDLVNVEVIEDLKIISNTQNHDFGNENLSLESILRSSVDSSKGKLVATAKAIKSAQSSTYSDYKKVSKCLQLLESKFYEVYSSKSIRLDEAIQECKKYYIEFRGDSSQATIGRFPTEYIRDYKGKKVEIGKHLAIGDSRSPERCFRLHFHWDSDCKAIIIHHAGKHLSTING